MFDGIKRRFTNPPAQANALTAQGDINAPVNLINLILENGTQITVPLDIRWSATQLQADAAPSQLLHWRTRLTDLLGRDDELASLKAWALGGADSSQAQVIVGDGGVGKTRLAMELADWLSVNQHWRAGALSLSAASSFRALGAIAGNTLIVVDYPEANPDAVKRLLRAVLESEANKSIKLLFLTREHESMSAVIREAGAQDLFAPTPLLLMPFADAAYALFCAAFKAVATQSNALPPNRATFAIWQSCSPLHAAALFLVAAGISVARYPNVGGASDAIPIGVKLLERMCEDETRKLQDVARGVGADPEGALDVLAIATLLGDINFDSLVAIPDATVRGITSDAALRDALIVTGHATTSYDFALTVGRLEPDLFAAAFIRLWYVARWKAGSVAQAQLSQLVICCLIRAQFAGLVVALNQWNRIAFDSSVRLQQLPNFLDLWLSELVKAPPLRDLRLNAIWSMGHQWNGLPVSVSSGNHGFSEIADDEIRATLLNNRSANLWEAGNREGAMVAVSEAIEIHRRVLAADPVTHARLLASSLSNLAVFKSATGDQDVALANAQEATSIFRGLASIDLKEYTPDLTASLNTLAICQGLTGNHKDAAATAQEAVEKYRELQVADASTDTVGLAICLASLANRHGKIGNHNGALTAIREAVEIFRRLAANNPVAYMKQFAVSLSNLASFYSDTGDYEGALVVAHETITVLRSLAAANPAAHTPDLARALCVLAIAQGNSGNVLSGARSADEAMHLLEPFANKNFAAFGGLLETAKSVRTELTE